MLVSNIGCCCLHIARVWYCCLISAVVVCSEPRVVLLSFISWSLSRTWEWCCLSYDSCCLSRTWKWYSGLTPACRFRACPSGAIVCRKPESGAVVCPEPGSGAVRAGVRGPALRRRQLRDPEGQGPFRPLQNTLLHVLRYNTTSTEGRHIVIEWDKKALWGESDQWPKIKKLNEFLFDLSYFITFYEDDMSVTFQERYNIQLATH